METKKKKGGGGVEAIWSVTLRILPLVPNVIVIENSVKKDKCLFLTGQSLDHEAHSGSEERVQNNSKLKPESEHSAIGKNPI